MLERLGYHDSGMPEWDYKDRPDTFWNVPIDESAARLAALMEQHQPQVVITYDEFGGYNHPDHVQANRITLAAIERTGIPAKLYFTARRWSDIAELRERMAELGVDVGPRPQLDPDRRRQMEASAARITTTVDAVAVADRKRDALRATPASWPRPGSPRCPTRCSTRCSASSRSSASRIAPPPRCPRSISSPGCGSGREAIAAQAVRYRCTTGVISSRSRRISLPGRTSADGTDRTTRRMPSAT